jgi:H+-transporting ATPase
VPLEAVSEKKNQLQVEEMVHVEVKEEIEPELEALLHANPREGLSTAEAEERLLKFGRNGTLDSLCLTV